MQRSSGLVLTILLAASSIASAQTIHGRSGITLPAPPKVEAAPVTDNYSGTKVVDNYRWLEDAQSAETKKFIDDQNTYSKRYMDQAKIRPQIVDDLAALQQVTVWSTPIARGDNYFFQKRLSGEGQASIYMRTGWQGKDKRLIDPAAFSKSPNTSVHIADLSRDGALLAYEVREGGADETAVRIWDVKAAKPLIDELPAGTYYSVTFAPDAKSIYYSRTNEKGTLLYQHVLGTRNAQDTLLFGREFRGELLGPADLFSGWITDDGHYLVVQIDRGVPAKRVDIVFRDLTKPGSYFDVLTWGIDSRFEVDYDRGTWYVKTDYKAPNGAIYKADPGIMPDYWTRIVAEGADPIEGFSIVGHKLYVNRMHDVKTETQIYTLDGKSAGSIDYGGIGSASGVAGRTTDRYGFYSFETFTAPGTIYRLDTTTGQREVFAAPKVPMNPDDYEVRQVFFKSKDGTRVPMFIAGKKGLKLDGSERLLMTGYGGFDVSETPAWNPMWAWWLEQGGWFALPNLRGGSEYGEKWHEQAMFERKQNVFDDFEAAAEYLIANKYTSAEHFAITGRSNGGLLMGAAMTERPELFSAIVCGYPLLDMMRYQKFEKGAYWVTEYGSSDNADQVGYLLKYSPYQNVKKRADFPAILFFTGSSDTRVDPLHARKMAALMQASSTSGKPILLHYGMGGGHSSGVGIEQLIEDQADQMAFLWTESGGAQK